ncbi:hypothetical protein GpartN1_g7805.t1 [Galdieria partita]|uniref:Uncharacterized protein n=1 Tax=Galdieria partita TaxID=83374 RepID=A0A9C7Q4A1_9RHOD|nr:hypothetical protein GpartN1_g7795.t1 [Galdieria partita]GJQ16014.1 hypothetical protein GpartN1_g7805.t1 [Galdieria partita]
MKDKLSIHPVEKYWKERKQKEKNKKAKLNIEKKSKRRSVSMESLEEEMTSLIQKKNEGVLLNAERERLRYLVQLHDNILDKQSKNLRNGNKESSQDPLDPEYGEDNRTETRKRLLGVQAFQRILEKSKVDERNDNPIEQTTVIEEQNRPNSTWQSIGNNSTTTTSRLIPVQVYPSTSSNRDHISKKSTTTKTENNLEQELNSFYAELEDIIR